MAGGEAPCGTSSTVSTVPLRATSSKEVWYATYLLATFLSSCVLTAYLRAKRPATEEARPLALASSVRSRVRGGRAVPRCLALRSSLESSRVGGYASSAPACANQLVGSMTHVCNGRSACLGDENGRRGLQAAGGVTARSTSSSPSSSADSAIEPAAWSLTLIKDAAADLEAVRLCRPLGGVPSRSVTSANPGPVTLENPRRVFDTPLTNECLAAVRPCPSSPVTAAAQLRPPPASPRPL
eukprot:scaffold34815_cov63-Phaeocystis_antarctica.AAC.5